MYPDPNSMHEQVMKVLHGGMAHPHISPRRQSNYAKILAMLAADHERETANQSSGTPRTMGGAATPEDNGAPAGVMQGLPNHVSPTHPIFAALQGGSGYTQPMAGGQFQAHGGGLLEMLRGAYG